MASTRTANKGNPLERIVVASQLDAGTARRAARRLAAAAGFDTGGAEAVALAATELATNLVRYARGGEIRLSLLSRATPAGGGRTAGTNSSSDTTAQRGVQVESLDAGPGIPDLHRAMQDGYTTGAGLGAGLGAVQRLMDELEVASTPEGTHIVARKWVPPRSARGPVHPALRSHGGRGRPPAEPPR